mmetsp:Transcript_18097/g.24836  ORF Transcript_18097/g.24836 Transcript_18097/m.24836 type:complete len:223 (-) Transcript_18097:85-753(-)
MVIVVYFAFVILALTIVGSSSLEVKEKATGHMYTQIPEDDKKLELVGVGVRVKKIGPIKVNVYSAALYLEKSSALLNSLKAFKGISTEKLQSSEDLSNALGGSTHTKSIVLKMARDVGSNTMVEALAESVKPRIVGDSSSLSHFQSLLSKGLAGIGAKKNTEFRFRSVSLSNQLSVAINGVEQGVVNSGALCRAFFNVYLDQDSVSPPLKASVCHTISKWLL